MEFADYLDSRLVVFLESTTQEGAIDELISLVEREGKLPNRKMFQQAIWHREQIISTGIGMSIAIPHAKLSGLTNFFIAIGIQRTRGIEWNALDGAPVRLVFLIGGPDDRQSEYLQILSQLTTAIRDADLRKELLRARSAEDVIAFFS